MSLGAARAQSISSNANHANVQRLVGWSIKEAAGSPSVATVTLRNGAVGAQILFEIELAADEATNIVFPRSIRTEDGVYVEVVTGTVSGVLFYE